MGCVRDEGSRPEGPGRGWGGEGVGGGGGSKKREEVWGGMKLDFVAV